MAKKQPQHTVAQGSFEAQLQETLSGHTYGKKTEFFYLCHEFETLAWIKFTFIMSLKRSILLTNADISINIFQQNVSIELRGVIKYIYIYIFRL